MSVYETIIFNGVAILVNCHRPKNGEMAIYSQLSLASSTFWLFTVKLEIKCQTNIPDAASGLDLCSFKAILSVCRGIVFCGYVLIKMQTFDFCSKVHCFT